MSQGFIESRPEITKNFQKIITSTDAGNIVTVVDFGTLWSAYTPPTGFAIAGKAQQIKMLQLSHSLPSIRSVPPPDIRTYDSVAEILAKENENYRLAPTKGVIFHIDYGDGVGWQYKSERWIQNTGLPVDFKDIKTPWITDEAGFFGESVKIGAQISSVGYPPSGLLGTGDKVIVSGSLRLIPTLLNDLGVKPFTNSSGFSVSVGTSTPVQVLAARSNRARLTVSTTGKIWFSFQTNSAGVSVGGGCPYLVPNGVISYENGRLSFEGGNDIALSTAHTLQFPLWAIAEGSTATVSGVEYW